MVPLVTAPWKSNCGAGMTVLNVGRFAGLGVEMSRNAPQSFVSDESRNAALATLQRIALTEKLLGSITRCLQTTHLQSPNL